METTAGLEKMLYGTFVFKAVTYKRNQIPKRIVLIDDKFQLPTNSILHLLDNLTRYGNYSDVPTVTSNLLLINEIYRKYIYHNITLVTDKNNPLYLKTNGIYRTTGISKVFIDYTKRHRGFLYPARELTAVLPKTNILTLINHNPLWRLKVLGKLSDYRTFDQILRAIINQVSLMPKDKYQFIEIPLSTKFYEINDYRRPVIKNVVDLSTVKYHDDYSYFMLLHLFSFIFPDSTLSLFNKIPTELYDYVNLIFRVNNNAIVYNLADLKNMVKSRNDLLLFIRHINLLKMTGITDGSFGNISKLEEADIDLKVDEYIASKQIESTTTEILGDLDTTGIVEEPVKTIPPPPKPKTPPIPFHEELKKEKADHIQKIPDITPAQKDRLINISNKYKEVKIGETPIEHLITTEPDVSLNDNTLHFLESDIPDKSMLHSSISNFDTLYMNRLYKRDLAEVLISFSKSGLYLTDYEVEEKRDELSAISHHKAVYVDEGGKQHTVKFKLPIVDKDGTFMVNGIRNRMRKQQINIPICKLSPTRVSLSASYKTLIERNVNKAHSFVEFITAYIKKINAEIPTMVEVKYGTNVYTQKLPYEYTTLGGRYNELIFGDYNFFFDFSKRKERFGKEDAHKFEAEHGVLCGTIKGKPNNYLYYGADNRVRIVNIITKEVEDVTTIVDLLQSVTTLVPTMVSEWTDLKILDQKLPIIFVLGYRYGLLKTLKYLGVDFRIYDKGVGFEKSVTDMAVKFKDKTLVYNRYPIEHSLIVNGLFMYKLNRIEMSTLDDPDAYYDLLVAKNVSTNYIKGIDTFFELFLDPITRDVLARMGEPTNIRDLLIRASSMLATEEHIKPASMANHRLRSYERFNTVLYDEMARQLAKHKHGYGAKAVYSINPEAVFQRIIQDQSVDAVNEINPIQDIKDNTGFTYAGSGGRSATSFVLGDRQYPDDGIGILSEATPDSGKVAINAFMSMNPRISDLRGFYDVQPDKPVEPTELFSITGVLMPGVSNDDPKRINFVNIQLSHHVPCMNGEPGRVRTGYEKVVAHRSSSNFAYTAKDDGKVIDVNEKLQLLTIEHKDKTRVVVRYGTKQGNVSGIYLDQKLVLNTHVGAQVKKGDIIVYNPGFFTPEYGTKQVNWKQGVHANVMLMESDMTHEDSSGITEELGRKLSMRPTELRTIKLNSKTIVYDMKQIGDVVSYTDNLCTIEDEDIGSLSITQNIDDEAFSLISELSRKQPKAKFNGVISDINIFYTPELKDIHPSLQTIARKINGIKNQKAAYAKDTLSTNDFPIPDRVPVGTKMKTVEFDADTVVIQFYITEDITAGVGDKIVIDSSLKSVIAAVLPDQPVSETGIPVDAIFSLTSIGNRVVLSPLRVGMLNRVMEDVETEIVKIFFEE